MAPMHASTMGLWLIGRWPRRQNIELRKSAKLMSLFKLEYESSFLSPILDTIVFMTFDPDGLAPPVQMKFNGQKMAFSTSKILWSYFNFLMVL